MKIQAPFQGQYEHAGDGSVSPFFSGPSNRIMPRNLGGEFISEEEHRRILNRINELLIAGDKFETIQRLLETRKP